MPTGPLIILLAASVVVCGVLTVLVIGRKGARDRREARFAYRRRRYLDTVLRGSPAHLRAIAAEACGDTTAQVDLAIAIDQSGSGLGRVRQERLADATAAAALTDTLRRELRSRRAINRGRAVMLITRPGLTGDVEVVAPLVRDPDPDVRLTAIGGLARIGTPAAARVLIDALARGTVAPERIIERLGARWAVDTVVAALGDGPPALRANLARALGLAGERRAESALLALLADGALEEQVSAARSLGTVGGPAAVSPLIAALASEEWQVRAQAAKSLGALGADEAAAALEGCLGDRAWWVRANAARSLRQLGAAGRAALTRALDSPDAFARDRAREQLALDAVASRSAAA